MPLRPTAFESVHPPYKNPPNAKDGEHRVYGDARTALFLDALAPVEQQIWHGEIKLTINGCNDPDAARGNLVSLLRKTADELELSRATAV